MGAVIALVGRPNVGKSSLFNRLLRRSAALVDDRPGVTRDRHHARLAFDGRSGLLVDTGGYDFSALDPLAGTVTEQIMLALDECDLAVLVVDGQTGLHPRDHELADVLRRSGRPTMVAVNKIDFAEQEDSALEFHALGLDPIVPVSAAHGFGLRNLRSLIWESLEQETEPPSDEAPPRVAVIGRPNAGKSSLINQLAGKLRQVVDDRPGTTRDAVDVELNLDGRKYVLVDTAGVRRKGRTSEKLEKLSVMRALRSLERADVAFLVIDALEGLADQDAHIAGYAHERGRPLALLLNKWDAVDDKLEARRNFQKSLELKMSFLEKTPWMTISALNGAGLHRLFPLVDRIMSQYVFRAPTAEVNKVVEAAVAAHAPPFAGRGRIKFFYSAQVSIRPPSFVIFANRPESVHFSYRRFLVNRLRDAFNLDLSPVKLHIRSRRETDKPESIPARVRARKTGKNKTVKSGVTGRKSATPRRGSRSAKTGRPGKTGGGRKS